jgi:hypothetical protein
MHGLVALDPRSDAGVERLIDLTCASGQCVKAEGRGPTALFHGGSYLSPMAGSSLLFWPFALT